MLKYPTEHSVTAHINRLRQMGEELRSVDAPVPEEVLIMRIIQTLPPSYDTFQTVWNNVVAFDQTIVNLTAKLVAEELRIKSRNNGGVNPADVAFFATHPSRIQQKQLEEAALAAKAGNNGGHEGTNDNRGKRNDYRGRSTNYGGKYRGGRDNRGGDRDRDGRARCYYCGKPGHKEYACRFKKEDERRQARKDQHNKKRDNDDDHGNSFACLSSLCFVARKPTDWYADSGATHHMTDQRSFFTTFREVPPGTWKVNGVGSTQLETCGVGNIPIHSFVYGEKKEGELRDVLFVPGLGTNLFSIGMATDTGINVNFTQDKVAFFKSDTQIMSGQRVGKSLYHLKIIAKNVNETPTAASTTTSIPVSLMDLRLAHLNYDTILKMDKLEAVDGLKLNKNHRNLDCVCEGCIFGKMERTPFPTGRNRATKVGQIIHSDVGFVPVQTPGGETCYVIFKDDYTNWTSMKLMKQKFEVEELFMKFAAFVKTTTGNSIQRAFSHAGQLRCADQLIRTMRYSCRAKGNVHRRWSWALAFTGGNRKNSNHARQFFKMYQNKATNLPKKMKEKIKTIQI